MTVQSVLCLTWSETLKSIFLMIQIFFSSPQALKVLSGSLVSELGRFACDSHVIVYG